MKKTVIITGYTCNNNCRFCYDLEKRKLYPDLPTSEVKRLISGSASKDYLDLIGGEFTIRPDATEIIRFAKTSGFREIAVTTNGRLFSYKDVLKRFKDAGLSSIIFSIHGNTPSLHDSQTMVKGSFRQLMKGVENALTLGFSLSTNTTITNLNIKHLPKIARFLDKLGCDNAEFPFLDPTTGGGNLHFHDLMPRIRDASPYIRECLKIGKNKKHWHIRYFPLCYLEGYESRVSEATTAFENESHFGPEFQNHDVSGSRKAVAMIKPDSCRLCRFDKICEGVWKRYAEEYGLGELVPVR